MFTKRDRDLLKLVEKEVRNNTSMIMATIMVLCEKDKETAKQIFDKADQLYKDLNLLD